MSMAARRWCLASERVFIAGNVATRIVHTGAVRRIRLIDAVLGLGLALEPQRDAVDAGVEDAHDGERDPEVAELQQRAEDGLLEVLYVAAGFLVAPKKTSESRH